MSSAEFSLHHASPGIAAAVRHALFWLVVGNSIGVMIAILLLFPALNPWLGEWTYGRWMMVHMNLALYGWGAIPMLAFVFRVFKADRGSFGAWCRPVVWLWSASLVIGSVSWLSGHSSGKLFLDWSGYARVFFPLTMAALWVLLAISFLRNLKSERSSLVPRITKTLALLVLFAVPLAIYAASDPNIYPAFNPDTGGPTGTSQLESSLTIVFILLCLPFGLTRRRKDIPAGIISAAWIVLLIQSVFCALLARGDVSHHHPEQFLSLATMLVWLPLTPAYFAAFAWHPATKRWRVAFLWWWSALISTGFIFFLPGVLDRFKFTDGLVGHSLAAMAGFLTALLIFVMIQLLGQQNAWIFNRTWSFHAWNVGVLAYVILMTVAGWIEGGDPAFTIVPGFASRRALYPAPDDWHRHARRFAGVVDLSILSSSSLQRNER